MQKKIEKPQKQPTTQYHSLYHSYANCLNCSILDNQSIHPTDWHSFVAILEEKNNISKKKQQLTYAI